MYFFLNYQAEIRQKNNIHNLETKWAVIEFWKSYFYPPLPTNDHTELRAALRHCVMLLQHNTCPRATETIYKVNINFHNRDQNLNPTWSAVRGTT